MLYIIYNACIRNLCDWASYKIYFTCYVISYVVLQYYGSLQPLSFNGTYGTMVTLASIAFYGIYRSLQLYNIFWSSLEFAVATERVMKFPSSAVLWVSTATISLWHLWHYGNFSIYGILWHLSSITALQHFLTKSRVCWCYNVRLLKRL